MNVSATYLAPAPDPQAAGGMRLERDALGEIAVPASVLYGAQTQRAVANFPVSGLRPLPVFVDAMVWIKRSAATT